MSLNKQMSLRVRTKAFSILLPFMEGKDKGEMERLIDTPCTLREFGFLKDNTDGADKEYVCFIVDEDPQHFFFGGQVLTDNLRQLDAEGYHDEIAEHGLPVLFEKKKSKNKREYTTVTFYPEA